MILKKRHFFNLIKSHIGIKKILLLLIIISFQSKNHESLYAYEITKQNKLFSNINVNKKNIYEIEFKKLPDKKTILNKYERGKLNPFDLDNQKIPKASGLIESQINVLGIVEYESKKLALVEYKGLTYKICKGKGGVCSNKQKSIFPKQWLITDFDLNKGCIIYLTNSNSLENKSICQSK